VSQPTAARFAVRFVILGLVAGTVAGYSAYIKRPTAAGEPTRSAAETWRDTRHDARHDAWHMPQISNASAKTDRLALLTPAALPPAAETRPVYALASALPSGDLDGFSNMMATGAIPVVPLADPATATAAEPKPPASTAAAEQKHAALTPTPRERAKHTPPPAPRDIGVLDDSQIASLKHRLHLTSDQIEYWPAVEAALRDVVRTQLRPGAKHGHAGRPNIDVNSPEVQKLIWAAMPLLMRMREDQKNEVRKLARVIGLDQVASQI
jgi:hypothetical protein